MDQFKVLQNSNAGNLDDSAVQVTRDADASKNIQTAQSNVYVTHSAKGTTSEC